MNPIDTFFLILTATTIAISVAGRLVAWLYLRKLPASFRPAKLSGGTIAFLLVLTAFQLHAIVSAVVR